MPIKANRGGENREFSESIWHSMPADKYGWAQSAEVPEEVKAIQELIDVQPVQGIQLNDDLPPAQYAEIPEEVNNPKKHKNANNKK